MKACRIAVEHITGRDESLLWFGVFQRPYFISVFPSILTKRKMGTNNPDPTGDKNADNHFPRKVGEGQRCALRELDLSLGWSQVTGVWLKHPHTLCVWLVYMGILFTVLRCCLDNWDVFLRLLKSPITYIFNVNRLPEKDRAVPRLINLVNCNPAMYESNLILHQGMMPP